MKSLKEALISKDKLNWASTKEEWPNPFGLNKFDAKGILKGYPIEVITLAMIETILQNKIHWASVKDVLRELQNDGFFGCFLWTITKDGNYFWNDIRYEHLDIFYKIYTPELLKERIEEVRPLIPYYKPKKH